MSDGEGIVQRADALFTEEVLAANDGKVIPLRKYPGGPVVGTATLKYVSDEKALKATFDIDDPKVAEFLKGPPPNIFDG